MSPPAGTRKLVRRVGTVTSDRMAKTIVVKIERKVLHPVYKKYVRRRSRLVAHDERNEAKVGDTVELVFTRPLSKTKRWRLLRVVTRAAGDAAARAAGDAA